MSKLTDNIKFNFIRYANCWEDADLLIKSLKPQPGKNILSVASGGDNSFSLLTCKPNQVIAVDINKTQLYITELKKIAIKYLSYNESLDFLGFNNSSKRIDTYKSLRTNLSKDCESYWDTNLDIIAKGIIYSGKFEKYFQFFSKKILPLIHSKKIINELFKEKPLNIQEDFYYKKWNNYRWRLLFKIFFSRFVMGRFGRDKKFFDFVDTNVANEIYNRAEKQLKNPNCSYNHILRFALTGNYGNLLPHYLKEENFNIIKLNIDNIVIKEGFIDDYINYDINYVNMSNIFEYLDNNTFKELATKIYNNSSKNTKFAYWNLLVDRDLSEFAELNFDTDASVSNYYDKGFFYKKHILSIRK